MGGTIRRESGTTTKAHSRTTLTLTSRIIAMLARMPLLLENRGNARLHHLGEFGCVPIGQPDATVRFGVADVARLRRPLNPVGFFGQADPDPPDRSVRPGLEAAVGTFCF